MRLNAHSLCSPLLDSMGLVSGVHNSDLFLSVILSNPLRGIAWKTQFCGCDQRSTGPATSPLRMPGYMIRRMLIKIILSKPKDVI